MKKVFFYITLSLALNASLSALKLNLESPDLTLENVHRIPNEKAYGLQKNIQKGNIEFGWLSRKDIDLPEGSQVISITKKTNNPSSELECFYTLKLEEQNKKVIEKPGSLELIYIVGLNPQISEDQIEKLSTGNKIQGPEGLLWEVENIRFSEKVSSTDVKEVTEASVFLKKPNVMTLKTRYQLMNGEGRNIGEIDLTADADF